ncbi:kinase-like domain-containing protein [Penicillium malachiteum]|uniref:Kinase-like domain-containing protein n=1 Tax=Penicillium malachiteum TaxID=1324776 RepID=A0AAD6MUQ5_9EURO|nr:kinase-like domain-containing protein [Penicillium malachiteum]
MDPHTASDSELVDFCLHGPPDRIIGGIPYGPRVARVSDEVVIKYSPHVTKYEAENQQRAYELVDPSIVRIPRVHRYFQDEKGVGYIMMEFLEGKTIDPLEDPTLIDRVVKVLDHFSTISGQKPGNLAGGPCAGILWESSQPLNFSTITEMEAWLNSRLLPGEGTVSLRESDLVLCHLDIAPRNIIWQDDGTICIVDWESACFYPRLFEFWTHWNIEGKDGNFNSLLLNAMTPLPSHELSQKDRVCRLWYNTQKYAL